MDAMTNTNDQHGRYVSEQLFMTQMQLQNQLIMDLKQSLEKNTSQLWTAQDAHEKRISDLERKRAVDESRTRRTEERTQRVHARQHGVLLAVIAAIMATIGSFIVRIFGGG